jgi:hypothetical protein
MVKFEFDKRKFAQGLSEHIVLPVEVSPVRYAGSMLPLDAFEVHTDDRIIMSKVFYTTNKPIHGIMHYEGATQLFFLGYQCGKCDEIFLVPDSVVDEVGLARSMWHKCTVAQGGQAIESRLDLRTSVLHVVQDIGRPGGLGSVGCEQYTDRIMELVGQR